jgi:hypothetical protein
MHCVFDVEPLSWQTNFQKGGSPYNDEQGLAGLGLLLNTTYRLQIAMNWLGRVGFGKRSWVVRSPHSIKDRLMIITHWFRTGWLVGKGIPIWSGMPGRKIDSNVSKPLLI